MNFLIAFLIAAAVGLTGIGAGSFTVPALVVLAGLPAGEAVGTAFVFAGVLRLVAALLQGAVPGLLVGTFALRLLRDEAGNPGVVIVLGVVLAASASITFAPRVQNPGFAGRNPGWLRWLALPIGVEAGFSSAGAGALGTMLLLNYSEMTPPQVVGTDLVFGLVLAAIGGVLHWKFGAINTPVLVQLLAGGVPGVLLGCALARVVPGRRFKAVVAAIAIFAGMQLIWNGANTLLGNRAAGSARIAARAPSRTGSR